MYQIKMGQNRGSLSVIKQKLLFTKEKARRIYNRGRRMFGEYVIFHIFAVLRVARIPFAFKPYAKIPKIKDRHRGDRCFIVATGPSLKVNDVEALRDEITFSVNSIDRMFINTSWRPTYYALYDARIFREKKQEHNGIVNLDNLCMRESFLVHSLETEIILNAAANKVVLVPCCFLNNSIKKNITQLWFSKNLLWGHYDATSVVNFCIQIAQYMGIKEIYLLGVDCNYFGPKQYFDDRRDSKIKNDKLALIQQERMLKGYTFIKTKLDNLGIKVFNATRGGGLETFPRVDFDEIIKKV
jgi:hypothetical protein